MASHYLKRLSAGDFGWLVYQLVRRCGEFIAVQWYNDARSHDGITRYGIVARKITDTGYERWYIRCQHYARINYAVLRDDLDALAQRAIESPGFTPHAIVLATACNISPRAKAKAIVYARDLGLPAPLYWDLQELDTMLAAQPETEQELYSRLGRLARLRVRIAKLGNWPAAAMLGVVLLLAIRGGAQFAAAAARGSTGVRANAHAGTHANAGRHRHTHPHEYAIIHTYAHEHANAHSYEHANAHPHEHADTRAYNHADAQPHAFDRVTDFAQPSARGQNARLGSPVGGGIGKRSILSGPAPAFGEQSGMDK